MRRRHLLATLPALVVTGCTAPTPDGGSDDADTNDDVDTTSPPEQSPADTDWSVDFQVRGVECTDQETGNATIDFGADSVTANGAIIGSNACYVARVDTVTYDGASKEMVIVVESVEEAGEDVVCAQCISAIDYTAVVTFDGPLPDRMVVRHRRDETVRTVVSSMR